MRKYVILKIKIYFHIANLPGWFEFVQAKTALMKQSGLWNSADRVIFELHYPNSDFSLIKNYFSNDPKVEFWESNDSVNPLGEVYSRIHLRECCQKETEPIAVFCYHTKGLSHRGKDTEIVAQQWSSYLDYWNIEQWRIPYSLITRSEYETAGVNWHPNWDRARGIPGHYSGNVWWARSDYIANRTVELKKPHKVGCVSQLGGFTARHDSELWIASGNPRYANLHRYEHGVVYHVDPPRPENYRLDCL